jgi:hypothetical protein
MKITMTILFFLTLCAPAISQDTPASHILWGNFYKGNDIIASCKQAVTDYDEGSDKWEHGPNNAFSVGLCKGLVAGVASSMYASQVWLDNLTLGQLVRVVSKYLDEHPETLDRDAGYLIRQALIKAFPPQK